MKKNCNNFSSLFINLRFFCDYIWIILLYIFPFKVLAQISDVCRNEKFGIDSELFSGDIEYCSNVELELLHNNDLFFNFYGSTNIDDSIVTSLKTFIQPQTFTLRENCNWKKSNVYWSSKPILMGEYGSLYNKDFNI